MSQKIVTLTSIVVAVASLSIWAADKHSHGTHGGHTEMMTTTGEQPTEGGQSTMAALVEIVALLEQNPKTDWSTVDLDSLHSHLLDMNHIALGTQVTKKVSGDTQIGFNIRGNPESIRSIQRMVPAHSRFIQQSRGWNIESVLTDTGATLAITVNDTATLDRLNALGFYGFMALDSHHQSHHYQIAKGMSH